MKEDRKWFDDIRDRMDGFEEPVPDGLWEDVEASIFPERRRRPVWLWRSVAAAAAVAAGVFAGVRLMDGPSGEGRDDALAVVSEPASLSTDSAQSENPVQDVEPGTEELRPSGNLVAAAMTPQKSSSEYSAVSARPASEKSSVLETETSESVFEERLPEEKPEAVDESVKDETPSDVVRVKTNPDRDYAGQDQFIQFEDLSEKGAKSLPVTVNVSFSGASAGSDANSFDPMMFYRGSDPSFIPSQSQSGDCYANGVLQTRSMSPAMFTSSSQIKTETDHKRPVRIALTAKVPLGKVLGVESGLSYSTLRSTFTTTSGKTVSEDEQTLRYLGIPLNLTAAAFSSRTLSVYVSGGAMAEKCVYGKMRTTETVSGTRQGGAQSKDLSVKPVLWSLNAAAGAQVNLGWNLGLYAEPGVSYHFDDGSSVQTVYKERPFDFVMTFGVRYTFK